jgi:ADP-heptose:LPS heptosyltransferase/GT2 family glycosyltransferase
MPRRPRRRTPDLRLELAPRLGGREALGRHDTLLVGQVIAAGPLAAIAVTARNQLLARLDLPADPAPGPTGFQLALARRQDQADAFWRFTVHVTAADGTMLDVDCAASRQPGGDGGVIEQGPVWSLPPGTGPLPPLIAYVERAALDPTGTLALTGWALGLRKLVAIQAYLGLDRIGAARLRQPRDDLAPHYPAYPDPDRAGFLLLTRVGPEHAGAEQVTLTVTAEDGTSLTQTIPLEHTARLDPPASGPPESDPAAHAAAQTADRRRIHHHFDHAEADGGILRVGGWAASPVGIDAVRVHRGDRLLGEAELGLPRPDVAAAHPTIPMARHAGFTFAAPLDPPAVEAETITLTIRTKLGDELRPQKPLALLAPAPPARPPRFRLEIDRPALADGAMVEPVTTRLTVEGWALAEHAAIASLTLYLDDHRVGEAHTGLTRPDVERALPDWPGALRCGFACHVPPRLLRPGEHRIRLLLRAEDGTETERSFALTVQAPQGAEDGPRPRARLTPAEAAAQERALDRLGGPPAFRLRIEDADGPGLAETLASLDAQSLPGWQAELVAADPARIRPRLEADRRVTLARPGAWPPAALGEATLCAVLRAGDTLDAGALGEIALAARLDPAADLLYADDIRRNPAGEREAFFKPGFSPDLLAAWNYIGRAWFATAGLLRRAGGLGTGPDDRLLRLTEAARAVVHVPQPLLRAADTPDDPAAEAARAAALARAGTAGTIEPGLLPGRFRIRRAVPPGTVSILIPTNGAGGHIETCIASLRALTAYRDFELICIENIPPERAALRPRLRDLADQVIAAPPTFNWSHFNNLAAAAARGSRLLFLNDDVEAIDPGWLDAMLEAAADPAVGVVGARLLYPDRTVQHAGMFLSGTATGRHAFRFAAETDPGYFGLALTPRNVSAVTGAAMLMRREHFDALGGFDETHQVINNDLDFCLRTLDAGKRVVVTPHATLIHHELASRGRLEERYDLAGFERRWRPRFAAGDPFHNPNLASDHDDWRPNEERARIRHGGAPRLPRAALRRILVVKLDHIGDVITALPAIRRLKSAFPEAAIRLLAAPAAVALAALEPAIEAVIPFAFFHARSALGLAEQDPAALAALDAELAAFAPDLAIDLRKHLDTREILRRSGARWTAGYDHLGQFPWLDIALEWEADRPMTGKRSHITEDLLRLIAAVELAAAPPAAALAAPHAGPLPAALGALFDAPVIAVHPGTGNPTRQWPVGHFVALLGLILARHPVRVLLIGGPDEADAAAEIADGLAAPDRVASAVGGLGLGALPGILARCALFIGNNSGPQHIAAALGVPTVGIHSGTVDATEWGPEGPAALAISRAMSCAPCYLSRDSDCPRDLACIRGIDPGTVYAALRPVLATLAPAATAAARPRRRGAR